METYTVPEVARLFSCSRTEVYKAIQDKNFPFPILRERRILIAKKEVDEYLRSFSSLPWRGKRKRGRPRKERVPGVHYNVAIPQKLHEEFSEVARKLPLTKSELVRLALTEFCSRHAR